MEGEVVSLLAVDVVLGVGRADEGEDEAVDAEGGFDDVRDELFLVLLVEIIKNWIL